ncbi:hypothetical protein TrLO_g11460 [Triparma laevis f. longispina]|uniref:KNTC1 third ARM-repeats domain-containing protein n=1 Tax=Triparma laevis f. longispina TaxID=1714387 RepID=A0A9W7FJS1_9STRA|nr:hypothetical protein TrLO_g11460 [Triparma laevis f. longispina]
MTSSSPPKLITVSPSSFPLTSTVTYDPTTSTITSTSPPFTIPCPTLPLSFSSSSNLHCYTVFGSNTNTIHLLSHEGKQLTERNVPKGVLGAVGVSSLSMYGSETLTLNLSSSQIKITPYPLLLTYTTSLLTKSYDQIIDHHILGTSQKYLPIEFHPSNTARHAILNAIKLNLDDLDIWLRRLSTYCVTEIEGSFSGFKDVFEGVEDVVKVYDVMKSIGILKSVENVGDKICKAVGKKWGEEVRGVVERLKGFIKLLEFFGESFSVLPEKLWGIKIGGDYLTYLYSRGFYKTGNNIIQYFNIEEKGILEAAMKVEKLNLEMFIKNLTLQNISMPLQSLLRRSNTPPTSSLLDTYKKYLTSQTSSSSILKRNNGVKNSSVRRGDNSEVYSDEECLRGMELGGRFGRCLREVLEGGKEEGEMVLEHIKVNGIDSNATYPSNVLENYVTWSLQNPTTPPTPIPTSLILSKLTSPDSKSLILLKILRSHLSSSLPLSSSLSSLTSEILLNPLTPNKNEIQSTLLLIKVNSIVKLYGDVDAFSITNNNHTNRLLNLLCYTPEFSFSSVNLIVENVKRLEWRDALFWRLNFLGGDVERVRLFWRRLEEEGVEVEEKVKGFKQYKYFIEVHHERAKFSAVEKFINKKLNIPQTPTAITPSTNSSTLLHQLKTLKSTTNLSPSTLSQNLQLIVQTIDEHYDLNPEIDVDLLVEFMEVKEECEVGMEVLEGLGEGLGDDNPTNNTLPSGIALSPNKTLPLLQQYLHQNDPAPLITYLQKNSSHILTLRLLSSTSSPTSKETTITKLTKDLLSSSTLDSPLISTLLTSLPPKISFKIYKESLPHKMALKQYENVAALSCVGVKAGKLWGRGEFVEQCERLRCNAEWWKRMEEMGVEFSPKKFDPANPAKTTDYATTLLPLLISSLPDPTQTLPLALKFCTDFNVDPTLSHTTLISHILTSPTHPLPKPSKISHLKTSLTSLPTTALRLHTLRKTILELESKDKHATSYHLHSLSLDLYYSELGTLLRELCEGEVIVKGRFEEDEEDGEDRSEKKQGVRDEIERVERRRDCIAILETFKESRPPGQKLPHYNRLFQKFPVPFGSKQRQLKHAGVLINLKKMAGLFDPLNGLRSFLKNEDDSAATILAPLSTPLQLPAGYVQARFLQEMFLKEGGQPPKFEQVRATMVKLPLSDGALLGEWCASQYGTKKNAENKLSSLKLASQLAAEIQDSDVSSRIEDQLSLQISEIKVREILDGKTSTSNSKVDEILGVGLVDCIISKWEDSRIETEMFVTLLLLEGGRRAAESIVESNGRFTMEDFRVAAWRIHSACAALAEEHENVDVSKEALSISKRIVEQGWAATKGQTVKAVEEAWREEESEASDYDDEFSQGSAEGDDFVMDLNLTKLTKTRTTRSSRATPTQPSAAEQIFDYQTSSNEVSELEDKKSSIMIAFLLSYSRGYFGAEAGAGDDSITFYAKGLLGAAFSLHIQEKKKEIRRKGGILEESKLGNISIIEEEVEEEADSSVDVSRTGDENSSSSILNSSSATSAKSKNTTFLAPSFASKHRAMSAALTLCPVEDLEKVKLELGGKGLGKVSLDDLKFSFFVASELETLSLPMPTTTIVDLSQVQLSGLARSLWRDHRTTINTTNNNGRFFLLLIKLCMADKSDNDSALVKDVIKAIVSSQHLPRTLLQSCEILVASKIEPGKEVQEMKGLLKALGKTLTANLSTANTLTPNINFVVSRFVKLITNVSALENGGGDWSDVGVALARKDLLLEAVEIGMGMKATSGKREKLWNAIKEQPGGEEVLKNVAYIGEDEKGEEEEDDELAELVCDEVAIRNEIQAILAE